MLKSWPWTVCMCEYAHLTCMTWRGTRTPVEPPSSPTMSTTSSLPSAPSSAKLFACAIHVPYVPDTMLTPTVAAQFTCHVCRSDADKHSGCVAGEDQHLL